MDKEGQKEKINNLLVKKYSLHVDDWVSLDDLMDSSLTYSENLDIVKGYLSHLINEHPQEFVHRIGREALERLQEEFLRKTSTKP